MNKTDIYNFLEKYGDDFRTMRKKANLSQLQVAHSIGCSQAIISHIECGYMLPPPHIEFELEQLYKGAEKNDR